jgi:hypothetical protein
LSIEDIIGAGSSLERGLALRDGGVWAAKSGRFFDAIRLFEKAREAFLNNPDNTPLAAGLLIEMALAHWRAGEKSEALLSAASADPRIGMVLLQLGPTARYSSATRRPAPSRRRRR